eukprot:15449680-Alexandrium_andersonii.AAC.1
MSSPRWPAVGSTSPTGTLASCSRPCSATRKGRDRLPCNAHSCGCVSGCGIDLVGSLRAVGLWHLIQFEV